MNKKLKNVILVASLASVSIGLNSCAALGDLAKVGGGASKASSAWDSAESTAANAEKMVQYKADLTKIEAEITKVQAEIKTQTESLSALATMPDASGLQAKLDEAKLKGEAITDEALIQYQNKVDALQAKVNESEAKLAKLTAQKEEVMNLLAGGNGTQKYGPEGLKGSATSKAVASSNAPSPIAIVIPKGKIALVSFSYNRQVVLDANKENKDERLEPGLLNNKEEYWAPQKNAAQGIWDAYQADAKGFLANADLVPFADVMANEAYKKIISENGAPISILGMKVEKDEFHPAGLGTVHALVADQVKELTAALNADYLVTLEFKANYGAYDANYNDGKLHLRMEVLFELADKTGKLITQGTYVALSENQGTALNNELYPNAITTLSVETLPKLLEILAANITVEK